MNEQIFRDKDERLDEVNDNLKLIQRTNGLTFGTDAFLLSAFIGSKHKIGCEFGSGTGIISLLLLQKRKADKIFAYELQKEFAILSERNAVLNKLSDKMTVFSKDVRSASIDDVCAPVDFVFSNPPYMKANSGINNKDTQMNLARREISGDISDFCVSAAKILKWGGRFYCVYRPDRLAQLLFSLKQARLEPKKLTLVHPDFDSPPSLVLVEARYGGGEELKITRPLLIYKDKTHLEYTEDMNYIYSVGSFPEKRF